MTYSKTIVCLANSRKLGGRCIAGKEWNGESFGAWIRPVGSSNTGELYAERYYEGWKDPQLLDVVELSFLEPRPVGFQSENHVVDTGVKWKCVGRATREQLLSAVDIIPVPLWFDGASTRNGCNDVVPNEAAEKLFNSLLLLQPDRLTMVINTEGAGFPNPRRKVRGHFPLGESSYILSITDPTVQARMEFKDNGYSVELQKPIISISIGEKFQARNAYYKLIAGVIQLPQ